MTESDRTPAGRLVGWLGKGCAVVLVAFVAAADLASFSSVTHVQAQPVEDPRWTQFTRQQDNLISNNVRSVLAVEDAVWFGADTGISRFTGEWVSFPAADALIVSTQDAWFGAEGEPALWNLGARAPPGQTTALAVDAHGRIWAGTDLGSVAVFETGIWRLALRSGAPVQALAVTEAGVWIGTTFGLYLWHEGNLSQPASVGRRAVNALHVDNDVLWAGTEGGLWRLRDGHWMRSATSERWLQEGVLAIWVDDRRTLWVGTRFGVGWRRHSSSRWQFVASEDDFGVPASVQGLATDHSGALWAATDGAGVFSYIEREDRAYSYGTGRDPGLSSRFVRGVAVDQDGSVWLATPAGAYRYQAYIWQTEVLGQGAHDFRDFVNALLLDREDRLWIATGGAGIRVKYPDVATEDSFGPDAGVPGWVFALAEDRQGNIWAGTYDGVVRYTGEEWERAFNARDLPEPEVISLLAAGANVWIGTQGGLAVYDTGAEHLSIVSGLANRRIDALAVDGMGNLWVGAGRELYILEGVAESVTLSPPVARSENPAPDGTRGASALPGGSITGNGLAADPKNPLGMWINLYDVGLVYWDGTTWHRDLLGEHVPGNLVWMLASDPMEGSLWVGSESGISRYDGHSWALLTARDGLQTASIHAFAPTRQGGYWIGGRNGLTHFRPDMSPPWIRVSELGASALEQPTGLTVIAGATAYLRVEVGDLQTPDHRIQIIYRQGRIFDWGTDWGPWELIPPGVLALQPDAPGERRLEFQARDLSFNYSKPVSLFLQVLRPSAVVTLPLLGSVPEGVFRALIGLGLIVVLGTLYITVELARHRRRSIEAVRRKFNPYISGEPVRRDDMFFGRRALLQRLVDTLHHNSVMIHGERRIGKTTLLYQLTGLLREVDDADYWFAPVYIDLEGTTQEGFFHYLIDEIAHAVETLLEVDIAAAVDLDALFYRQMDEAGAGTYTDREFNRDLRHVVTAMQAYGASHEPGKQARLILLLDEMDVVSGYDQLVQQQLRRIFMREFAATVGAVVAGIRISKAWDRVESPWFNLFNEIALEPFTRDQGRELLVEPVRGYYRYRDEAIEFILDMADGRPFRIQQYGLESVNQMLNENRRTILLRDAQAAYQRLTTVDSALEAENEPRSLGKEAK